MNLRPSTLDLLRENGRLFVLNLGKDKQRFGFSAMIQSMQHSIANNRRFLIGRSKILELFSIIWNLYPFYEPIKLKKPQKTLILVFLFYFRKVSFSFLTICCATKKSFLN